MPALAIDTCSHFCWFIIPIWTQIKQNFSYALIWWMISWENSTTFCFLKPSTHTLKRHTKTHFQVFHFLCTGLRVREIRSHTVLQVPTTAEGAWGLTSMLESEGIFFFFNSFSLFKKNEVCLEYWISIQILSMWLFYWQCFVFSFLWQWRDSHFW